MYIYFFPLSFQEKTCFDIRSSSAPKRGKLHQGLTRKQRTKHHEATLKAATNSCAPPM